MRKLKERNDMKNGQICVNTKELSAFDRFSYHFSTLATTLLVFHKNFGLDDKSSVSIKGPRRGGYDRKYVH
jgi:hypothetical protein